MEGDDKVVVDTQKQPKKIDKIVGLNNKNRQNPQVYK